jgi:hypothetical protein
VPLPARGRLDLAPVQLGGDRARGHAGEFVEDRPQRFGALLCFSRGIEALRIGTAELHAAALRSGQRSTA